MLRDIIIGARQTGKTTYLIKECEKMNNPIILVPTAQDKLRTKELLAEKEIKALVLVFKEWLEHDLPEENYFFKNRPILIDDLGECLSTLSNNINLCTFNVGHGTVASFLDPNISNEIKELEIENKVKEGIINE